MSYKRKKYLTKIRYPTYSYGGRLVIRYCTKCAIKDGASIGYYIFFGQCSFCGKRTRTYSPSPWNYPVRPPAIKPGANERGYWRRVDTWKDHKL